MSSVLGTILDPAADKTLMTTLTVTLAMKSLIPGTRHFHLLLPSTQYLAQYRWPSSSSAETSC